MTRWQVWRWRLRDATRTAADVVDLGGFPAIMLLAACFLAGCVVMLLGDLVSLRRGLCVLATVLAVLLVLTGVIGGVRLWLYRRRTR